MRREGDIRAVRGRVTTGQKCWFVGDSASDNASLRECRDSELGNGGRVVLSFRESATAVF